MEADPRPLRSTDKRVFLKVRSDEVLFLPSEAIELKAQLASWLDSIGRQQLGHDVRTSFRGLLTLLFFLPSAALNEAILRSW